jgi:signal transduction histidine kinase
MSLISLYLSKRIKLILIAYLFFILLISNAFSLSDSFNENYYFSHFVVDEGRYQDFNSSEPGRNMWPGAWIYFVFISVLAGIISGLRKYELSRIRLRNRMWISEMETIKLKELNKLKSQLFLNISHEFRTPLTLIKGPLEQLREEEKDPQKRDSLRIMLVNASLLLNLINQLIDLSKLESDHYDIKPERGDIAGFLRGITLSFSSLQNRNQSN